MDRKVILFELNEVPVKIFEHFCRAHPNSVLAQRMPECLKFETYTEDKGWLEPWITWPTLHRGITNDKHQIADFGQDLTEHDSQFPPIWKLLVKNGIKTGICGSLHTYPMPSDLTNYEFFMPDTFAAGSECFPDNISAFQAFNLQLARESARNISTRIPWQSALNLLAKAPGLGFKLETAVDLGRQVLAERSQPWQKTRRRSYQAVLAFDVFMKYLEKTRPGFATFFTNHVASSMHRYWAAVFPGDYKEFEFTEDWVRTYQNEIDFTMGKFAQFFEKLVAFVDQNQDYQLWVATSMGQAATRARPCDSQLYIVDLKRFMSAMGLEPSEWTRRPAMLPQTNVLVASEKVASFREKLKTVKIDGEPIYFREAEGGFFSIDLGQEGFLTKPQVADVGNRQVPFAELGMKPVEIDDKSHSSAYHIPNGTLLIYDPLDRSPKPGFTQISTTEIAPTLLDNYSVPIPSYMTKPIVLTVG
jgi:hypothetical protein